MHDSLSQLESSTQTAYRSVHPFLLSSPQCPYNTLHWASTSPLKITPCHREIWTPHLTYGSLGPPVSSTQMASRSVQPFLQGSLLWDISGMMQDTNIVNCRSLRKEHVACGIKWRHFRLLSRLLHRLCAKAKFLDYLFIKRSHPFHAFYSTKARYLWFKTILITGKLDKYIQTRSYLQIKNSR